MIYLVEGELSLEAMVWVLIQKNKKTCMFAEKYVPLQPIKYKYDYE